MKKVLSIIIVIAVLSAGGYFIYTAVNNNDPLGSSAKLVASYVGLTEQEAAELANSSKIPYRVVRRDQETYPVTLDFNPERRNFEIDNGVVTKVTEG